MIINSFSDYFNVSIKTRIRIVFIGYGAVALIATVLAWFYSSNATDWNYAYDILFPLSLVFIIYGGVKISLGMASMYLFPLLVVSIIRIIDLWQQYFTGQLDLQTGLRASTGWLAIAVSISFVDLLESRIYHKLVQSEQKLQ